MQCKATHALLASNRCLIDLQQVLFQRVTNALLKSNQAPFTNDLTTDWLTAGYKPAFCTCSLHLQMICLKLCNGFSKSYLSFQRIKMKRSLTRRLMIRIDSWQSWPCFCFINHFGSSVKAIWKASTHLTEEPKKADEIVGSYPSIREIIRIWSSRWGVLDALFFLDDAMAKSVNRQIWQILSSPYAHADF